MLVMSRKEGQRLTIDTRTCPLNEQGLIEVKVVKIRGSQVKIGVEAVCKVEVHRKEVFDAIQRELANEKESAAATDANGRGTTERSGECGIIQPGV